MISLQAVADHLDTELACVTFSDYCLNGIQVDGKLHLERVATAVTASLEAIEAAVAWGADALVVHHGLFWDGVRYPIVGPLKRKLELLLQYQMSLLAYHLPLDAHQQLGNNWVAARALGLQQLEAFAEFGVMGELQPAEPIGGWLERVASYYGVQPRTQLGGPEEVTRVGIVSGGAHKCMAAAVNLGLDCFVTGTGDGPNAYMATEEGIHFIAVGHETSEKVGPRALASYLKEHLGLETTFVDTDNLF